MEKSRKKSENVFQNKYLMECHKNITEGFPAEINERISGGIHGGSQGEISKEILDGGIS